MHKTRCLGAHLPTEMGFRPLFIGMAAFLTASVSTVPGAPALAAETAQSKRPSVEVDLGVLDDLPAAKPGEGGPRIILRPPRAAAKPNAKTPPATAAPARGAAPKPVAKARPAPPTPIIKAPPAAPKPVAKAKPGPPTPIIKAPPVAPKPVAKAKPTEPKPADPDKSSPPPVAARDVTDLGIEKPLSIAFAAGSGSLPKPPPEGLDTLVRRLAADQALRIVIYAYAKGTADSASKARRLSFSRALAVRRYLVGKGVRGTRAEIRALGNQTTKEPADRVDLVLVKR